MQTVRFAGWTLLTFVLSFIADLSAAHACSCVPTLSSSLAGAVNVPLDVAPILRGYTSGHLTWTAQDGSSVAFDERLGDAPVQCPGPLHELRPKGLLTPNTLYTIRAKVGDGTEAEIRFTTGTTSAPELPLPTPSLKATLVRRRLYDSCTTETIGCLALGDTETEVTLLDERGTELSWFVAQGEVHWERARNDIACIEARTRNAAGRRSEPARLCTPELAVHEPFASDYEDYRLRCMGGSIPSLLDSGAAVPWPSDAGVADAATARSTDSATTTAVEPTTATDSATATVDEPDDGCSVSGDGKSGALLGLLAVFVTMRRCRSRD